ncbi:uncharacterized protein LOC118172884 [Oxyura jamaicensis]|uniref:uncharacterized protein LOC118172884 n=1 Tax=Oxyura jamaicensis TaxID=8884 RepID=UPI0015A67DE4|nr:uncharacterized protein LOC118172884 [Oxyura jamaicensis]
MEEALPGRKEHRLYEGIKGKAGLRLTWSSASREAAGRSLGAVPSPGLRAARWVPARPGCAPGGGAQHPLALCSSRGRQRGRRAVRCGEAPPRGCKHGAQVILPQRLEDVREQRERQRGGPSTGRKAPARALHHRHAAHAHGGHAVPGRPEGNGGDVTTLQPVLSATRGAPEPPASPRGRILPRRGPHFPESSFAKKPPERPACESRWKFNVLMTAADGKRPQSVFTAWRSRLSSARRSRSAWRWHGGRDAGGTRAPAARPRCASPRPSLAGALMSLTQFPERLED